MQGHDEKKSDGTRTASRWTGLVAPPVPFPMAIGVGRKTLGFGGLQCTPLIFLKSGRIFAYFEAVQI
jgi:hypothetical protein